MQAQPHNTNGGTTEARDELDVAFSIIRSSEYNEILEQINLGTGYYSDEDLAMQMRNIRKGLVTEISFSETLRKRAVQETKVKLADEGFAYYDTDADEVKHWQAIDEDDIETYNGRTSALFARGDEIWSSLADPQYSLSVMQAAAIEEKTSLDPFKAIFNHLAATYHEATKSKGARTQDNYFGRVKRHEMDGDAENLDNGLLGGRSGGKNR